MTSLAPALFLSAEPERVVRCGSLVLAVAANCHPAVDSRPRIEGRAVVRRPAVVDVAAVWLGWSRQNLPGARLDIPCISPFVPIATRHPNVRVINGYEHGVSAVISGMNRGERGHGDESRSPTLPRGHLSAGLGLPGEPLALITGHRPLPEVATTAETCLAPPSIQQRALPALHPITPE